MVSVGVNFGASRTGSPSSPPDESVPSADRSGIIDLAEELLELKREA